MLAKAKFNFPSRHDALMICVLFCLDQALMPSLGSGRVVLRSWKRLAFTRYASPSGLQRPGNPRMRGISVTCVSISCLTLGESRKSLRDLFSRLVAATYSQKPASASNASTMSFGVSWLIRMLSPVARTHRTTFLVLGPGFVGEGGRFVELRTVYDVPCRIKKQRCAPIQSLYALIHCITKSTRLGLPVYCPKLLPTAKGG